MPIAHYELVKRKLAMRVVGLRCTPYYSTDDCKYYLLNGKRSVIVKLAGHDEMPWQ